MSIDVRQLRDLVVRPTLTYLGLPGGEVAERLVMGTAAQESKFRYIHQLGRGPARGLWQMEPATFRDLWDRTDPDRLRARIPHSTMVEVFTRLRLLCTDHIAPEHQMVGNLYLGCAMCRIHYYFRPFAMPSTATVQDLAHIWKIHYNTVKGRGTEAEFITNYLDLLGDLYMDRAL